MPSFALEMDRVPQTARLQTEKRQRDRNVAPVICEIAQPVLLYWHPEMSVEMGVEIVDGMNTAR